MGRKIIRHRKTRHRQREEKPDPRQLRRALQLKLNRLSSRKSRQGTVREALQLHPEWSDRAIAKALQVSPTTVGAFRRDEVSDLAKAKTSSGNPAEKKSSLANIPIGRLILCKSDNSKPARIQKLRMEYELLSSHLNELHQLIESVTPIKPDDPFYQPTRLSRLLYHLEQSRLELLRSWPSAYCPACDGRGKNDCQTCHGRGLVFDPKALRPERTQPSSPN